MLNITFTDESATFINLQKAGHNIFTMLLTPHHFDSVFESLQMVMVEFVQLMDGLKEPLHNTLSSSSGCNLAFPSGDDQIKENSTPAL